MGSATIYNFRSVVVDVTPVLTTGAYAQNDVLFDFTDVDLGQGSPVRGTINAFTLLDKDDNGNQVSVFVSDSATASLGTVNSAVTITDADAATILGYVDTGETYEDLIASKIVRPSAFAPIGFNSSTGSIYVGGVLRGAVTPTHTASGIVIRLYLTIE
jgi:hypothetical protein